MPLLPDASILMARKILGPKMLTCSNKNGKTQEHSKTYRKKENQSRKAESFVNVPTRHELIVTPPPLFPLRGGGTRKGSKGYSQDTLGGVKNLIFCSSSAFSLVIGTGSGFFEAPCSESGEYPQRALGETEASCNVFGRNPLDVLVVGNCCRCSQREYDSLRTREIILGFKKSLRHTVNC